MKKVRVLITCGALPIMAVGAGISAYSAVQQGKSAKDAADYNAGMDELKARDSLIRGANEAAAKREQGRRVAGAQREGAAMSGVSIDTGTPLSLLTETAGLSELDAQRSMNEARREAWGLKEQAKQGRYQGKMSQRGGYLTGAGTFLSSAGAAYYGKK